MDSLVFDRVAHCYDDTRGFPNRESQQTAANLMALGGGLSSESRVLEVGMGTGRIALPLAPYVSAVHGVDLSRPMLLRLIEKRDGEAIYPLQADATRLPYPADSFDAVVGVHIFHLIPAWEQAFAEVERVIRPGGALLLAGGPFSDLGNAIFSTIQGRLPPRRGATIDQMFEALPRRGWHKQAHFHYAFSIERAPAVFRNQFQNRSSSSTWELSDAELAACLRELNAFIEAEYGDAMTPVQTDVNFYVDVYRRD